MVLDNLNINVGELVCFENIAIYRNDFAYIVFKLSMENDETSSNCLLINDNYYLVTTIEDLRTYKLEDF